MTDQWTLVAVVRTAFLLATTLAIFQQAVMVSHYVWRIVPLRRVLEQARADGRNLEIIAPPIGWTLAYHVMVAAMLLWTGAGTFFALRNDFPASPTVWFGPFIALGFAIVVNRFVTYYSNELNRAAWDQMRRAGYRGPETT